MNTYAKVQSLITAWKSQSLSRTDLIRAIAEACLGWPYVWGAAGQKCTPSHRLAYAARSACPEGEAARILKKCPVCSGKQEACSVCKYYPGGPVLDFDCRGFTRWLLAQAGVSLQGAGATSQWNTESNWEEKGPIADLPAGKVCCVFMRDGSSMSHTGMHLGNGEIIHCSGEVKCGKAADRGWTPCMCSILIALPLYVINSHRWARHLVKRLRLNRVASFLRQLVHIEKSVHYKIQGVRVHFLCGKNDPALRLTCRC